MIADDVTLPINLIGIKGYAGSGKDTFANMLMKASARRKAPDAFDKASERDQRDFVYDACDWEIKRFSGLLKEFSSKVLGYGFSATSLDIQEVKERKLGQQWNYMTAREFLQKLGTGIRDTVHKDFWCNALMDHFNAYHSQWIVPDTRFINEASAIRRNGGIIIGIQNDRIRQGTHISETEMDSIVADIIVENNGSLEELWQCAIAVAEALKL